MPRRRQRGRCAAGDQHRRRGSARRSCARAFPRSGRVRDACRPRARSIAWPPAMPSVPLAWASRRIISRRRAGSTAADGVLRQDFECQHLQRIAGEDRGRFVEGAVRGRAAAAQVVVIHGRQVVVNERIGVDQLDGRGRRRRAPRAAGRRPRQSHRPAPAGCACPARALRSASPDAAGRAASRRPAGKRSSTPSTRSRYCDCQDSVDTASTDIERPLNPRRAA